MTLEIPVLSLSLVEIQRVTQRVVLVFPRVTEPTAPVPVEPPNKRLPAWTRHDLRPLAHSHEPTRPPPVTGAPGYRVRRLGPRGGSHALPPGEANGGGVTGTEAAGEAEGAARVGVERV